MPLSSPQSSPSPSAPATEHDVKTTPHSEMNSLTHTHGAAAPPVVGLVNAQCPSARCLLPRPRPRPAPAGPGPTQAVHTGVQSQPRTLLDTARLQDLAGPAHWPAAPDSQGWRRVVRSKESRSKRQPHNATLDLRLLYSWGRRAAPQTYEQIKSL